MKKINSTSRSVIATVLASTALLGASATLAHADTVVYEQPHMVPVGLSINIGWQGDRYWDGHRYWAHDDWMRGHPHDHGPDRGHDREHDHGHGPDRNR